MSKFIMRKNGNFEVCLNVKLYVTKDEVDFVQENMKVSKKKALALIVEQLINQANPDVERWVISQNEYLWLYEPDEDSDNAVYEGPMSAFTEPSWVRKLTDDS